MARPRYRARTDGAPHRPWSSINVRVRDKHAFTVVHAILELERGHALSQWDVFSIVLEGYLEARGRDLPAGVVDAIARAADTPPVASQ